MIYNNKQQVFERHIHNVTGSNMFVVAPSHPPVTPKSGTAETQQHSEQTVNRSLNRRSLEKNMYLRLPRLEYQSVHIQLPWI